MLKHFITFLRFACQFFGFCLSNINVSGFGVLVHNAGKDYSRRERMGRQKGKSPRDQKKQQKQVKAITRELKRRGVPENKIKDNIHDILHDEGMDYQEALEEALNYFGV